MFIFVVLQNKLKQLAHTEVQQHKQCFPITIVCDALRTPENIGMCFRVAESFGVSKIYIHQSSPALDNRKIQKTARNTIAKVAHEIYSDYDQLITKLRTEGNAIIGLEITDSSVLIQDFEFKSSKKIALLIGSERSGLQSTNNLDVSVAIAMFGSNSSMNVIHSLAIALYEITNQLASK